uniref:Uncharacterized protein n=1 Tax=Romanomermis culicivorax TaxID=13658 RepID=A0A915HLV5_ROMCU
MTTIHRRQPTLTLMNRKLIIKISGFLWTRGLITSKIDKGKFMTKGDVLKEKLYTYTIDMIASIEFPMVENSLSKYTTEIPLFYTQDKSSCKVTASTEFLAVENPYTKKSLQKACLHSR